MKPSASPSGRGSREPPVALKLTARQARFIHAVMRDYIDVTDDASILRDARSVCIKIERLEVL